MCCCKVFSCSLLKFSSSFRSLNYISYFSYCSSFIKYDDNLFYRFLFFSRNSIFYLLYYLTISSNSLILLISFFCVQFSSFFKFSTVLSPYIVNNNNKVIYNSFKLINHMYSFTASKKNQNLLRVYSLKHCYQECKIIEKQKNQKYISNCVIIRKSPIKNLTDFGYKEEFKTNILKKINFVYLPTISDLLGFLWAHVQLQDNIIGMVLIENLQDYIGHSLKYRECGPQMTILMNVLQILVKKFNRSRVCICYCYQTQILDVHHYSNLIKYYGFTNWQITNYQILKNSQIYQSNYTQAFLKLYSTPQVKLTQ